MNSNWPAMKTVSDILKLSTEFLTHRGIVNPRRQVEELLSHVLNLPRIELYMQFDRPVMELELEKLRAYLKMGAQKMPWQYILGQVQFLGCSIEVSRDVLIPRPETEILADMILKELPAAPIVIWDVCCGSGCVGIALKKKKLKATVILSDLSHKAIEMARKNAQKNEVEVILRQGDLLKPFEGEKADIVVCNPPYVSEEEYAHLDPQVRDFEPKEALVAEKQGMAFYERLSTELSSYLNPGGKVYLEIGTAMGGRLHQLFSKQGWRVIEIMKDWSSHDRFIKLSF